jgi:hypothetical protein
VVAHSDRPLLLLVLSWRVIIILTTAFTSTIQSSPTLVAHFVVFIIFYGIGERHLLAVVAHFDRPLLLLVLYFSTV